jgi:hypothetical protein
MPSRNRETRCTCTECTRLGGFDSSGRPKGIMILSRNLPAHLACVQAEQVEAVSADIDEISARTFALALMDDGPDSAIQPSKLWTSRSEFQQGASQSHQLPDHSISPPVSDIVESVTRLSLAVPSSNLPINNATPSTAPIPLSDAADNTAASTLTLMPSISPPPHNEMREQRRVQKKEKNHRTSKILRIFDRIDVEIAACQRKLDGTPMLDVLQEIEMTLSYLHPAVERVKRSTPSIDARKRHIVEQLESLESRVSGWRLLIPASMQDPISYNAGV